MLLSRLSDFLEFDGSESTDQPETQNKLLVGFNLNFNF